MISISDAKFCTLDWPFFLICNKWSKFVATKIIDILSSQISVSAEYPSHQTAVQAHHCKISAEWVAHHWAIFCRVWRITKALQSSKCRAKCVSLYYPWFPVDIMIWYDMIVSCEVSPGAPWLMLVSDHNYPSLYNTQYYSVTSFRVTPALVICTPNNV